MAEEFRGRRTKEALARALRGLLAKRPLEEIRVRELTEVCMIRRQSFYYHFTDVYDLFAWSLRREADALTARQEGFLTWRQALEDLLEHLQAEEAYYRALLAWRGRPGLEEVLRPALEQMADRCTAWYRGRCALAEDAAVFPTEMLLTLLEGWVVSSARQPPAALLDRAEETVRCAALGAAMRNLPRQEGRGLS